MPVAVSSPEEVAQVIASPAGFASTCLGWTLHPMQEAVLDALKEPGVRMVVRCGNEVGKTARIATGAILWHLALYPHGQVVSTAGAWRQVADQLIPNLHAQSYKFPSWRFLRQSITVAGKDSYVGFSTTDQGRFQGYHGDDDNPLLIIIDEAAAVPDDIFMAAEDRCDPQRLLVMGSPLGPEGWFYDACTKYRAFYKQFVLRQTDCLKSQGYWLDDETITRKVDKWGKEHPIVLSSVFAEFAETVEGALLSLLQVEHCVNNPPNRAGSDRRAFLDFAAGGDENVIAVRQGNRCWIDKAWRDVNTASAVGMFLTRLNKLRADIGLQPEEVEGDADGLGKPMCDSIREAGWAIADFHANSKPRIDATYANRSAECWMEGARKIQRFEVILERDEALIGQLVNRKTGMNSRGQVMLESKADLAKRGVSSPDRADAILGYMMPGPRGQVTTWQDQLDRFNQEQDMRRMAGRWAG